MDYYKILNIPNSATPDEIKKAYRKLAIKWHPDKNKGNKVAEEKFKEISEAYDVLSNSDKRKQYDMFGTSDFADTNSASGFNPFDMFNSFFGGGVDFESTFTHDNRRNNKQKTGSDLKIRFECKLEDIIKDINKTVSFNRNGECKSCTGTGRTKKSSVVNCPSCGGTGILYRRMGPMQIREVCVSCGGSGSFIKNPCNTCNGSGISSESVSTKIKIPKGSYSGLILRIPDMGNFVHGGRYGDLFVEIRVRPDQRYERDGNNVFVNEGIPFYDIILGKTLTIKSLYGSVNIEIPKTAKPNTTLKVKNHGLPDLKQSEKIGDMYVRIFPEFPNKLSDEQESILELYKKTI